MFCISAYASVQPDGCNLKHEWPPVPKRCWVIRPDLMKKNNFIYLIFMSGTPTSPKHDPALLQSLNGSAKLPACAEVRIHMNGRYKKTPKKKGDRADLPTLAAKVSNGVCFNCQPRHLNRAQVCVTRRLANAESLSIEIYNIGHGLWRCMHMGAICNLHLHSLGAPRSRAFPLITRRRVGGVRYARVPVAHLGFLGAR